MPSVAQAMQRFHPTASEAAYANDSAVHLRGSIRDPRGFGGRSAITRQRLEDANVEISDRTQPLAARLSGEMPHRGSLRRHATEPVAAGASTRADRSLQRRRLHGAAVRPSRIVDGARIDFYWQTSDARQLQGTFLQLRGNGRNPVSERQRRTQAWREQAERFVTDLDH
jgi:hypothetical protein